MRFKAPSPPYLGPPHRSSPGQNKPIDRIVMHGTVSPTVRGGARSIAGYFRSKNAGGSAHYVGDPGESVQAAYDSVICWHAPPNANSIGYELCDLVGDPKTGKPLPLSRWDGAEHRAMLARAAEDVADLCLAYDVPAVMRGPKALRAGKRGICEHSDVSVAFGQSTHWDLGNFPRRRFIKLVRAAIARRTAPAAEDTVPAPVAKPAPAPKPTRKTTVTRVDKARDLLEQAARRTPNRLRRKRIREGLDALPKH